MHHRRPLLRTLQKDLRARGRSPGVQPRREQTRRIREEARAAAVHTAFPAPSRQDGAAQADPPASEQIPSLKRNVVWTLVGSFTYAACQWAMLSVLAKSATPAIVGQFALGLAVVAPVFMLTSLQLRTVLATDAQYRYDFFDFVALRFVSTGAALLAILGVALSVYEGAAAQVILLVAAAKAIESFGDVIAGLLQKHERLDQVAISFVLKGLVGGLSFAIIFIVMRSLPLAVLALAAGLLLVFCAYEVPIGLRLLSARARGWWRFNRDRLKRLFVLSLPLGIVMALSSLNVNAPRYIVERQLGAADLGIFASLAYPVTVINLLVNAVGQSALARLARSFAERDFVRFRSLVRKLVALGIGLGIIAIPATLLLGRWALRLLYTPEYAEHLNLLLLFVAAAGINAGGVFLGFGLSAAHIFRPQVLIYGASTFASFAVSLLLVPSLGLIGAGVALIISVVVSFVGAGILLERELKRAAEQS